MGLRRRHLPGWQGAYESQKGKAENQPLRCYLNRERLKQKAPPACRRGFLFERIID